MTRSPQLATLFAIIPLIALAFPLVKVLNPAPIEQGETTEESESSNLLRADVVLRSAHPFESATINDIPFEKGEVEKEVYFAPQKPISVIVNWAEGTPESAVLVEVMVDDFEIKSQTLWGIGSAEGDLTFDWSIQE